MRKYMFVKILLPTLLLLLNATTSAPAVEYGIIAERNNSTVDKNTEITQESELKLSLKGLETNYEQSYLLAEDAQALQKFSSEDVYEENEDMYEFIGMFISDYKSKQNIRIKLKMTQDAEFTQGSVNWKFYF